MNYAEALAAANARLEVSRQLCKMIVERLDLPIDPAWISYDQPLFGRGLELDSVDTLELMLGIESEFDVSLTDDDRIAFGSVARLTQRILADRPALATV
jgi:acyl carrier protein